MTSGVRVQQRGDPPPRDARGGERAVKPHQRLHRRDDAALIGHERGEGAERQGALHHAPAAVEEDGRGPRTDHERGQAARQIMRPLQPHQRGDEGVVQPAEARHFAALRAGRHDRPHPLQGVDQEAAQVGTPLTKRHRLRLDPPAVQHERPRRRRQRRGADETEPPVEPHEHRETAGQEQDVAEPRQRHLRDDALNLADVVVDPRDDVAEAHRRIEARRQALEVLVEVAPHVEQNLGRHARIAETAHDAQHEAGRAGGEKQRDRHAKRCRVARHQRVVDEDLREVRQKEGQRGADQADGDDGRETAAIGEDVPERPSVHGLTLSVRPRWGGRAARA